MPAKKTKRSIGGASQGTRNANNDFARTIRDAAQQIWLAGLGALAKTQKEGTQMFDALVEQGRTLETRTLSSAQARFGPTGQKLGLAAAEATTRALATWDWVERAFEQRLVQALKKAGAPSQADIAGLTHRLDALERQRVSKAVKKGSAGRPATPRAAKKAVKRVARGTPRAR